MNGIKVSLDEKGFSLKPTEKDIPRISRRIGRSVQELSSTDIRHLTMKSCAKWQNFLRKKNTYANAGISTRFLTVSPAAMISLP